MEKGRKGGGHCRAFQTHAEDQDVRYFTFKNTPHYIDVLQKLVNSYNVTYHHSIGMAPNEVNMKNEDVMQKKSTRQNVHDEGSGILSWATTSAWLRCNTFRERLRAEMDSRAVHRMWTRTDHAANLPTERRDGRAYKRQVLCAGAAQCFSTQPLSDREDHQLAMRM